MPPGDVLMRFRTALYAAFGRRRDALLDLIDALVTTAPASSLVHLCLAPAHQRGWGSLYAARRRGQIDADAVRALLLEQPRFAGPPVFAVDVSVWPRRDAETSPERAFHYSSPCQRTGSAVVRGWAYQWVAQLSPARDSWTAPVDVQRVRPTEQATQVAVEQVRAVVAQLAPAEGVGYRYPVTRRTGNTHAARRRAGRGGEPGPPWRRVARGGAGGGAGARGAAGPCCSTSRLQTTPGWCSS